MLRARRRPKAAITATLAGALAALLLGTLVSPVGPAFAADAEPAYVTLIKTATPAPPTALGPGDLVTFNFTINCSSDVSDCVGLQVTDELPEPLELQNVSISASGGDTAEGEFATTDDSFVLTFTNELAGGAIGLPDGYSVDFVATARVPLDADASFDGQTITNRADATLDYSASNTFDEADVLLEVPVVLDSDVDKTVAPTEASAIPGGTVDYRLLGENASNTSVESLVVQDPAVVGVSPFHYLEPSAIEIDAWPSGADRVQLDWYDGTDWVLGSPTATPSLPTPGPGLEIQGLRFTFTHSGGERIARDAVADIALETTMRSLVSDIDPSYLVSNTASSWVTLGTDFSTPVGDSASVRLNRVSVAPVATKTFTPDSILGGRDVEVALRAQNGGDFTVAELTIQEPAAGTDDLVAQGLGFDGWIDAELEWPVGATGAEVSFWYEGDADFSTPTTIGAGASLPDPNPSEGAVLGFRVGFTGSMAPGQYALVPYAATTESVLADVTTTNTISVEAVTTGPDVQSATVTASDDLTRRTARVETFASKQATPSSLNAVAGAVSVLGITAGVAPQPTSAGDTGGSTVGAERLVITDPVGAGSAFWDSFALTRILATDVPAGSRLTVEYLDRSATPDPVWTQLTAPQTGPLLFGHVLSAPQRENLGGIRFIYEPDGQAELPPGFDVNIYLRTALLSAAIDGDATEPYTVQNVVESLVENAAATPSSATADDDVEITLTPVSAPGGGGGGGGGSLPMADKQWSEHPTNGLAISARSGDEARATISWGTGGLGYDSVVVSDSALDPATPGFDVGDTVFEAFDLVEIRPITAGMDPWLSYDAVVAVELYRADLDAWVATATNPCAASACDGAFPGYELTPTERAQAVGARLVFEESPTRAARVDEDDPFAPPVGSGVAVTSAVEREIELVFAIRDERRSNGDPVLGSNRQAAYNGSSVGWVENSVRVDGRDASETVLQSDTAAHEIQILDHALNVTVTKDWVDGPLGVPPTGTDAALFPTARMTLTATNATVVRVDELAVTEPGVAGAGGAPDPFEYLNLAEIVAISVPSGADDSRVELEPASSYPDSFTIAEALDLTALELADATAIRVIHEGRIDSGAQTVIVLDTQLREFLRSAPSTRVDTVHSPVQNSVLAEVSDLGGSWSGGEPIPAPGTVLTASDDDAAQLVLESYDPAVVATKLISAGTQATASVPAIQYDGDSTTATISLRGRPAGNVRYTEMILEDTSPTFWNAYAFQGFSAHSFASPIDRVQVDALVDADYGIGAGNSITTTAGTWVLGTPGTSLALPAGVTAAEVRGLRITYTRDDYAAWERPYNPQQTASFTVQRRTELLTGGPVPSTLHIYDADGIAPGETERSTFTNDLTVTVNARETPGGAIEWTADDTDTKQLRFEHRPAKVEIRKSPAGPISLGDTIDYEVEVHNFGGVGDRALSGVVVTDLLPIDSSGSPYLVYLEDPDTGDRYDPNVPADAAQIFSFELRNSSNVLQPTPTVTVVQDAVTSTEYPAHEQPRLTFTLTGAQTIPLGSTLTIGYEMEFRPLLEAGTDVTNTATVVSDREFDSCGRHYDNDAEVAPGSLGSGVPPYLETASCSSATTVEPLPSAPLTIAKGVKGLDAGPLAADGVTPLEEAPGDPYDDLGIAKVVPTSPVDCSVPNTSITVNGGGYYRYPCVPITRPGSEHEWAATFTNSGNVSVRQIVAIDVLPRPGDTGITISSSRGSQWTPTLSSYPEAVGLPSGAALTVLYTDQVGMASARCNGADIQDTMGMTPSSTPPMLSSYQACLTDTGAIDDLDNRVWQVLPNDPEVWSDVVALKFVVLMDDSAGLTNLLAPASSISIVYTSTTALVPEVVETAANLGRDAVAYNSIAGAATGRLYPEDEDPLDLAYRLVTEPRKVGVALAIGGIELAKQNSGAASSYAPSTVQVSLACTVEGEPIDLLDSTGADRSTVTLTPGSSSFVTGIPLYAVCSATELDDYGQTSASHGSATLVAHAAHEVGTWPVSDPQPAFGDDAGGEPYRPEIERDTITNTYESASLVVGKTVDTSGAQNQAGTPIAYTAPVFSVSCTFDNGATNATIFSVTNITIAHGATVTFPRPATSDPVLPAGAVCTVTETNTRNATTTQYTVTTEAGTGSLTTGTAATVTLTPNDGATPTNEVAFLNTYGVGTFTVSKSITGLGAAAYGTGTFTVQVTCTRTSATPSTTVWSDSFTLSSSSTSRVISNLPAGAICTVTETGAAGATATSYSPSAMSGTVGRATVPNGSNATVTITNRFDLARLSLTKEVLTDAEDALGDPVYPTDEFDVQVVCTWQGSPRLATGYASSPMLIEDIAIDADGTSDPIVLSGLPAGASCAITEVNIPAEVDSTSIVWATGSTSGTANAATATVVLTADSNPTTGTNTARIVNRYDVSGLTITKDVQGGAGDQFGTGPFEISVLCIAPGDVTAYDGTITLPGGTPSSPVWTRTIENLPENSECEVAETNVASTGADASRILDADGEEFDGTGILVGSSPAEVTIENWYLTGSLTVGKETWGDGESAYGDGPFEVTVQCTRDVDGSPVQVDGFPHSEQLAGGETVTFTGLPSGADCTVSETDAGGATSSSIVLAADHGTVLAADAADGHDFVVAVDASELSDDQPQIAVDVRNEFRLAGLVVTKTVQSDAVDEQGNAIEYGPFPVSVSCTFEGSEIFADGYDADTPMTRSFDEGDPAWELAGLVVGAECVIDETDRQGSASSRIAVTPSGGSTATSIEPSPGASIDATIVLDAREFGDAENLAAIRNDYESGTVTLDKVIDGLGDAWATEDFVIQVVCTLSDGAVDPEVWNESYTVSAGALAIDDLVGVAAGAECTIDETATGGATSTTITIDGSDTADSSAAFTSPAGATPLEIVVTNTFELAEIEVVKVRTGEPEVLAAYGVGPFEVALACTREVDGASLEVEVPGPDTPIPGVSDPAVRVLDAAGLYRASYEGLPAGAECELTETRTGGANASTVTPASIELAPGDNEVEVENEFTAGALQVTKELLGDPDAVTAYGAGPFYVSLACTREVDGQTVAVAIPAPETAIPGVSDPAIRELSAADGYVAEYLNLPTGAECELTETGTGGATSSSIGAISPATIPDGSASTVTVSNTFDTGSLEIVKQRVFGEGSEVYGDGPFEISVECRYEANGEWRDIDLGDDATIELDGDTLTAEITGIVLGAECTVDETDAGLARSYTLSPADGVVTIDDPDTAARVTVINTFAAGELEVVKTASDPLVEGGQEYDYTIDVENIGDVDAEGVTLEDELDPLLQVVSIDSTGWDDCAVTGADGDGYGGTLLCELGDPLVEGASAPRITLTVMLHPEVRQDSLLNEVTVASTTEVVEGDSDDETVDIMWLDVEATPQCISDAPWLYYEVDAHNLDLGGRTMTVEWLDEFGDVVATDTVDIPSSGVFSDRLLWPGAAVDASETGIAWPGWRPALPGETPHWENLVLDPSLPEYALRSGAQVRITINPETVVEIDYPPATSSCVDLPTGRTAGLWLTKTTEATRVEAGSRFQYTLSGGNNGLGAVEDVVMVDEVPVELKVLEVTPLTEPADGPQWTSCVVTDQLKSGYGGRIECTLDRPLGALVDVPDILLDVRLSPDAEAGTIVNTAYLTATERLDGGGLSTLALEDEVDIWTAGYLADTGVAITRTALLALLALALGLLLVLGVALRGRRREV